MPMNNSDKAELEYEDKAIYKRDKKHFLKEIPFLRLN